MKTKSVQFIGYSNQYWWIMFLAGVVFISLGISILAAPVSSYLSFSLLFAFGMLFGGCFEVVFSLGNHKAMHKWGLSLAGGMIDFLLGAWLMNYPLLSMVLMPLVIGFWMLFRGCMAFGKSLALRAYGVLDWVWLIVIGALIILLSLLIIGYPLFERINIVVWTAFVFILSGFFRIYLSIQLRNAVQRVA